MEMTAGLAQTVECDPLLEAAAFAGLPLSEATAMRTRLGALLLDRLPSLLSRCS
jgi:hypothetical protein